MIDPAPPFFTEKLKTSDLFTTEELSKRLVAEAGALLYCNPVFWFASFFRGANLEIVNRRSWFNFFAIEPSWATPAFSVPELSIIIQGALPEILPELPAKLDLANALSGSTPSKYLSPDFFGLFILSELKNKRGF